MSHAELAAALASAGIVPGDDRPWSEPQRWVAEAARRLIDDGMSIAAVVQLARLGGALATIEVDAVVAEVARGVGSDDAVTRQERRRKAVTRLVAAVRQAAISETMSGLGEPLAAYSREVLHTPSELFLHRHGLNEAVEALRARASQGRGALLLGRLLIGLGRYAEARRWLEQALSEERSGLLLAHLALVHVFLGSPDVAQDLAAQARQEAPGSMLALVFSAVVEAFTAARITARAADGVAATLDLLARSRKVDPGEPLAHLEALLARGRISLLMPPPFGVREAGLEDLRLALKLWEDGAPAGAEAVPPGTAEIFRLNAHYFLGNALAEESPREACGHLGEVILIDPACGFAERAYHRISELGSRGAVPDPDTGS